MRGTRGTNCQTSWRSRQDTTSASNDKGLDCPTHQNAPIENITEISGLPNRKTRSGLSQLMKPEHKRMARMLGYALTLGNADAWSGFGYVAATRLTDTERAALAFSALSSLDPEQATMTAAASIGAAGVPLPPFLGGMDEARFWASCANRSELKAYAIAAYEALSVTDQAAFFRHISNIEVMA